MSVWLNVLIICAVIVLAPTALAILALIGALISDARSRRRMYRSLDDLIRERP